MVLYFLLLLSWVFLAIKDQFHFPTFISLQNMTLISLLMIVTCLILGWMNYIKRKKISIGIDGDSICIILCVPLFALDVILLKY